MSRPCFRQKTCATSTFLELPSGTREELEAPLMPLQGCRRGKISKLYLCIYTLHLELLKEPYHTKLVEIETPKNQTLTKQHKTHANTPALAFRFAAT